MSLTDFIIMIIIVIAVVMACTSLKKRSCYNCSRCNKKCGGKNNGRELKDFTKNKRK